MDLKFDEQGFIPTIIQNVKGTVLYLQFSNKESLAKMLETGKMYNFIQKHSKNR